MNWDMLVSVKISIYLLTSYDSLRYRMAIFTFLHMENYFEIDSMLLFVSSEA